MECEKNENKQKEFGIGLVLKPDYFEGNFIHAIMGSNRTERTINFYHKNENQSNRAKYWSLKKEKMTNKQKNQDLLTQINNEFTKLKII